MVNSPDISCNRLVVIAKQQMNADLVKTRQTRRLQPLLQLAPLSGLLHRMLTMHVMLPLPQAKAAGTRNSYRGSWCCQVGHRRMLSKGSVVVNAWELTGRFPLVCDNRVRRARSWRSRGGSSGDAQHGQRRLQHLAIQLSILSTGLVESERGSIFTMLVFAALSSLTRQAPFDLISATSSLQVFTQ